MMLDFEVTIEEVTDESLREYYRHSSNYEELVRDEEQWGNLSRQIRLQRALLEDEEALRRFLTYVVIERVDSNVDSELGKVFRAAGETIEDEILEPLFSRLDEEDASYFREASEAGELFECIEVLSRSFRARWTGAILEEIRPVGEGSLDELESDNLM